MESVPKHMKWINWIRRTVQSRWFPLQGGLIIVADFVFPLLPSTAMLAAASIIAPKRWFTLAFWFSVACGLGALLVTTLYQLVGEPILQWMLGDISQSDYVQSLNHIISTYGIWTLIGMGIIFMPMRTLILLMALSAAPIWTICLGVFVGRFIGFFGLAWISSRSPYLLLKIPFVRRNKMLSTLLNPTQESHEANTPAS